LTHKLLVLHGARLLRSGATAEMLASASPPAAAAPAPTRPTPAFGFGYRPGPGMPVGGVPGGAAR
ncbi:type I secretion system permease/ATPase, partial [Pseudomonas aeruginosa]|nr:type I secretion system permease/ATPase [Pseudomonas aeruginosa]